MKLEKMQGSKFESFKGNELQSTFSVLGGMISNTTEPSSGKCDQINDKTNDTGTIDANTGKGIDSRYISCSIEMGSLNVITSV
ncbi:hypothetical protein [Taibaiella soli]|uniref:Uncharacterized protein n=1 Tax=Taibaiella soli TaxID=1649169 RepID=A0A2W2BD88_9BACT|nr:hypothetical protein [Taibaiella soli]PZF73827.1 hypothetical protein DN068_05650 [Taibaiella soli]